jgi:hypothetical protein
MADTTFLIGIAGIVGTLSSGYLGAHQNARYAEKAEALRRADTADARGREVQAAARLVHGELGLAGSLAASSAKDGSTIGMALAATGAWTAHGALLAAELPDETHALVSDACNKIAALVAGAAGVASLPAAEVTEEVVAPLVTQIRQARIALAVHAYPTREASALSRAPMARDD